MGRSRRRSSHWSSRRDRRQAGHCRGRNTSKAEWCDLRNIVFGWTHVQFPFRVQSGRKLKDPSTANYHGCRQGVLRHRQCSCRSLKPENRSPKLSSVGDSSRHESRSNPMRTLTILILCLASVLTEDFKTISGKELFSARKSCRGLPALLRD
jgi:hypothetical protein